MGFLERQKMQQETVAGVLDLLSAVLEEIVELHIVLENLREKLKQIVGNGRTGEIIVAPLHR